MFYESPSRFVELVWINPLYIHVGPEHVRNTPDDNIQSLVTLHVDTAFMTVLTLFPHADYFDSSKVNPFSHAEAF